jgi:hypothetical protein
MHMGPKRLVVALVISAAVITAGCGKDSSSTASEPSTTTTTLAVPAAVDSAQSSVDNIGRTLDQADTSAKAARDAAASPSDNN